ncbi:MAG: alpha/beta hydrolase [Cellvibrio sp.]
MDNSLRFSSSQELVFDVDGLQFSAQAWGNPKHLPVMALHGWLDNSASFLALAALLNNVYIVAVDLAGHGKTDHRKSSAPYNIWEDVPEIFAIADQLGWKKFALLGHSRGAIISVLAAGTFPERISHLALIEGALPEFVRSEDAPRQLASSIKGINARLGKKLTQYNDIESAIKARENGMFPLSYQAAKLLTERGVKQSERGYHWSSDQRLLAPSAVKLLPEQMAAFIAQIKCPISLVLAEDGMPKIFADYLNFLKDYPKIAVTMLSGGHHLHMEQQVGDVAAVINSFFARRK